jgi:hypothetical protein
LIDRAPFLVLLSRPTLGGSRSRINNNVTGHAIIIYCSKHHMASHTYSFCSLATMYFWQQHRLWAGDTRRSALWRQLSSDDDDERPCPRRRLSNDKKTMVGRQRVAVYDDQDARGNGGGHQPIRAMVVLTANNGHGPPPPPSAILVPSANKGVYRHGIGETTKKWRNPVRRPERHS